MSNSFKTLRAAKSLRERHPDAPPSVCHVALVMAIYADGKSGTSIRPGFEGIIEDTGLSRTTVKAAVRWLEARGEVIRTREARRGSAALFMWTGGMGGHGEPPSSSADVEQGSMTDPHTANGGHSPTNGGRSAPPHQPDQKDEDESQMLEGAEGAEIAKEAGRSMSTNPTERDVPCTECGAPTEPYFSVCPSCYKAMETADAREAEALRKRGRDEGEIRRHQRELLRGM
jgi:hypothetical protein